MNEPVPRGFCAVAAHELDDVAALLVEVCPAPGCYLPNGEHTPEEVTACLERWLAAEDDRELRR